MGGYQLSYSEHTSSQLVFLIIPPYYVIKFCYNYPVLVHIFTSFHFLFLLFQMWAGKVILVIGAEELFSTWKTWPISLSIMEIL